MRKMEQVTRYRCAWCGKEFKTPDRHDCKWDPDAHNCLSCVHRGKYHPESVLDFDPQTGEKDSLPAGFECACEWDDWCSFDGGFGRHAASVNHEKHCPDYKTVHGWKGKATFREIEQRREALGEDKP